MVRHSAIWAAIDMLGRRQGWSLPKLAAAAGLDATALNPSKRFSPDGKPRWPSMETLAKLLSAADISFSGFAEIVAEIEHALSVETPEPTGLRLRKSLPRSNATARG